MSVYETYETVRDPRRHGSRREHRYERDEPRFTKTTEEVIYRPVESPQYRQDLLLDRHNSDMSVEEIRREFDPPVGPAPRGMVVRERYEPPIRSRSADRDRDRRRQYEDPRNDYRRDKRDDGYLAVEESRHDISRRRSLSRNQKIATAVGGAAFALGAKEVWDRKQAKDHPDSPKERNLAMNAAVGAAGAFAGWEGAQIYDKVKEKKGGKKELKYTREIEYDRDGHVIDYEEDVRESRPKPSRRKSIVETAMGLAGLGAGAKALSGRDRSRSRDRDRGRRGSYSDDDRSRRHRSRSRSTGDNMAKFQQAAKAALLAGATEAYRVRKEPGGWDGAKGKRILTAAVTAGGVGAAVSRGEDDGKSKRHLMEAVIGGLAGTKAVHGSRKELDVDDDGRSIRDRSRSRARSKSRNGRDRSRSGNAMAGIPIAALATAGMGLLAKKAHSRSRSRSRRRRSDSEDSYRSRGKRSRSKSVTDFARKAMAGLGIGGAAAAAGRDRSRSRSRDREVIERTTIRKERRKRDSRDYDSSDEEYDRRRGGNRSRGVSRDRDLDYDDRRSNRDKGSGGRNRRVAEGKQNVSDSDSLGSSSGDEKRIKKIKGRQFLTAGLATVATIHAAHGVYQSYEQRNARRKAVLEGDLSLQEARKMKAKARLQDAASIGIAALGVKGAVSEWKDMNEKRHEYRKLEEEKKLRHEKRLERRKSIAPGSSSRKSIGEPPNRSLTMSPGAGGTHDESDYDRDPRYSDSRRPNYQRHTSFPNHSEPDLPRYYDEEDKPYYPPPAPGSGYHGAPYGQQTTSKLPPPPMGYGDNERR